MDEIWLCDSCFDELNKAAGSEHENLLMDNEIFHQTCIRCGANASVLTRVSNLGREWIEHDGECHG